MAFLYHCRVHWEDTDASGRVYHANYLKFIERARSEILRKNGIQQRILMDGTGAFVVTQCQLRFRAPAFMEDELTVETRLLGKTAVRLRLAQDIREGGETLLEAEVELVWLNPSGKAMRLPDFNLFDS